MLYNSTNYANLEYKSIDPIEQFLNLIKLPEVQAVLHLLVENIIITSDLDILKRITSLEEKSESNNDPVIAVIADTPIISTTVTEARAQVLVGELTKSGKDHLTAKEIIHVLRTKLPFNCAVGANVHVHRPPAVTLNKTPEEFHISTGLR
jgi:hypothetical protein